MTNKAGSIFTREFLSLWGRFLSYREKQKYISTPEWGSYRLLKRRLDVAKYLTAFDDADTLNSSQGSNLERKPTRKQLNRSSLLRPVTLLEAIYWREPAEIARKLASEEKYSRELVEEKTSTAAFIEKLRLRYKKEDERRIAILKKEHAAKYSKALRTYREAVAAKAERDAKVEENLELGDTLPEIKVPECPERTPLILPKRERKVVRFKQHLKADPKDLTWRDQTALSESWEEDNFEWLTHAIYKDSFLLNNIKVGSKYKRFKVRLRRRRYRYRRKTFARMKLRRIRKDDKLQICWSAENNANVWAFNEGLSVSSHEVSTVTNPLNAYSLLYYNLSQTANFSNLLKPFSPAKVGSGFVETTLNYSRVSNLRLPPKQNRKVSWSNLHKYDTLAYFILLLSKERSIKFNNVATVLLLGVLPRLHLHKLVIRSSTRYNQKFYNSNFGIPSLNTQKVRQWAKKQFVHTVGSGVHSMYSMFLGSLMTSWLKTPTSLMVMNLKLLFIKFSDNKLCKQLVKKNIRFHYKIGTGFFLKEAVQVTLIALRMKDPEFFLGWFTKIMEKVAFFRHKQYIMFFRSVFTYLSRYAFKRLGLKGLYFDIRGKVAVKGDSKKRHILLRYGECTFSQKSMQISSAYGKVHTFTGVLGVTFILFF